MDLRGLLGATGVGGVFATALDVVVTGGDAIWFLVDFLINQGPLLYVLLARLSVVAERVEWLPLEYIRPALYVFAAVSFAVLSYRLLNSLASGWRDRNET